MKILSVRTTAYHVAVAAALLLSSAAFAALTHGPRAVHPVREAKSAPAPTIKEKIETTLRDLPPKPIIRLPGGESPQPMYAALNIQLLDIADELEPSSPWCTSHRIGPRNTIRRC